MGLGAGQRVILKRGKPRWERFTSLAKSGRHRERCVHIDALVDTGSSHTSLPESLSDELGIEREGTLRCELAGNRVIEYPAGKTKFLIQYPRQNTGERWAEKVAEEVARLLDIPHAAVGLATFQGTRGSASRVFCRR